MKNMLVAKVLYEIADLLEMQDVEWKPQAYRRAARNIETLSESIEKLVEEDRLRDIPGIGEAICEKVTELVETGQLKYYEKLKKQMPFDYEALLSVEGMGPKTVKLLWKKLKVKNLDDLEKVARAQKIRKLKGLGPKTEEKILQNIELARMKKRRTLLGFALPIAQGIKARLKKLKYVKQVEVAGSLRRRRETVGDIDILVTSSKPEKVADYFTTMEDVDEVIVKGPTRSSVWLKGGMQCDLRVLDDNQYGSALMYFTGNKEHNIVMRRIAISKGWKLSEYGLFKGKKQIAGKTEKEMYKKFGMQFIPPEMRENTGEIDAALKGKLPKIIGYGDMRGDLQMHSTWSDGIHSIEEMAAGAKEMGYEYICMSDHAGKLKIAGAMNERQLKKQGKEIDKINKKIRGIKILKGAEIDIGKDGKLEISNEALKNLDMVVASIHSRFAMTKEDMTKRIINAMENEYVNIIGHPTGRKIGTKHPSEMDLPEIFEASKRTKTYLEINSYPVRLDLNDINARAAMEAGCKLVINTDAHNVEHLKYMQLGISVARRAWIRKKDVINTLTLKKLERVIR